MKLINISYLTENGVLIETPFSVDSPLGVPT